MGIIILIPIFQFVVQDIKYKNQTKILIIIKHKIYLSRFYNFLIKKHIHSYIIIKLTPEDRIEMS